MDLLHLDYVWYLLVTFCFFLLLRVPFRLNLRLPQLISGSQQPTKQGTVSHATSSFIGVLLQRVMRLLIVINLQNTTVHFALVNGLRGGTRRGRTGLSQALFN